MGVVYMTALLVAAAAVFARWFGGGRAAARDGTTPAGVREALPHD